MKNRSFCNRVGRRPAIEYWLCACLYVGLCLLVSVCPALAGDAPAWMHAAASAPLPAYDDKTDAVLLYSEHAVTVQSLDKIKTRVRVAYKILRPGGREYGMVAVSFNPHRKITALRGWCIPVQGKDYEVKDKEAVEVSLPKIEGSELISDVKDKMLRIPAPDPGNVVGYEYEQEQQPMVLQNIWMVQDEIPGRELHYSLQIPAGWEYKASWINYPEAKPAQAGPNQWEWVVTDVKGIRKEEEMPPIVGVAGQMVISFFPPGGAALNGFADWSEMGKWYSNLTSARRDPSADITRQVSALTGSSTTQLEKMKALAQFVQHDIRYVAIELGIGGWQPHSAADVFTHRYGDCKDKATLLSSMLKQIGVESFYVVINARRGSITPQTPASVGVFNHVILAIQLPPNVSDSSLIAKVQHPRYGTLLYFDPTNELTPFGEIGGYLQQNYGLLVTSEGGELVELPTQPRAMNGIARAGKLTLDGSGGLRGEVNETRTGDRASAERWRLRTITKSSDRIKPIEDLLAGSLSLFRITQASIINLDATSLPFGFHYTFEVGSYAKNMGGLLLVRPRVLGVKTSGILETKEPRQFPIEFGGLSHDTDTFDIAIPSGYVVDDLPPPADADYSFASYHAKTEVQGNLIHYSRTFEVKELSVPVSRAEDLKKLYRIIASDERNTVVLKTAAQ
jgi:Domain of Unknown Function with PDB structure (DUF3857)/Transglutaminase-like superfamily